MGGLTLLDRARKSGLSVSADGDRLVISGPRKAEAVARELMARKGEILAILAGRREGPGPGPSPSRPWEELAGQRWAHAAADPSPGIVIAHDWRSIVARLPHDEWVRWRARSAAITATRGPAPDAAKILDAGRLAAIELGFIAPEGT